MSLSKDSSTPGAGSLHPSSSLDTSGTVPAPDGSRLYNIYHTVLHHHYDVTLADKTPLYHVENSLIRPKKPDLTVHGGMDESAPIVAVCKFLHFSRHLKVGLGDPQNISDVQWEDLVCMNYQLTKYRWQMTMRSPYGEVIKRSFVWKRTHSVGVEDSKPSILSSRNYKLVNEQTDRIVAVFTSNSLKSFTKCGKLQIHADYGREFELMVILTVLALYEKQRRRNNSGNGGGGGGGGG
ncbi:hypothetical protein P170DRAFT_357589 [Aspergillus steynii IBT 23096]|uniref:Uncharacterized protein n=1 Tax=Aspergillus steynii IBT 23096 TaxID=1392250 RepID=A0A2I2G9R5_9EURO|nr:uncharacterized protein P170DRAFT_357589 [Aspergillus steynii IBT 23096]PLB49615.1 hypothetical protein P170DRAFT_357589 [Aspergillus steynii IBT 23096]